MRHLLPVKITTCRVRRLTMLFALGAAGAAAVDELPELAHDAGAVYPAAVIEHRFRIANPGPGVWRILALDASCSCTIAKPDSVDVPAGGAVEVPVAFAVGSSPERISEALVTARIQRPGDVVELPLRLSATVRVPVVAPARIDLAAGAAPLRIAVTRGGHPAPWERLEARLAGGAEVLRLGGLRREGDGWVLEVAAEGGRWGGTMLGRIELLCLDQGRELPYVHAITAAVHLDGRLRSQPAALLIGAVAVGGRRSAAARITAASGDLAGAVVAASDSRYVAAIAADGSLQVEFRAAGGAGPANGWIEVASGEDRLRVPVIAAVAAAGGSAGSGR